MANAPTHELIGKALSIPAAIAASAWLGAPLLPFCAGQFVGLFLASPDVDTHSRATNRWGILRGIWAPLQAVTRHRGITHHPLLGAPVVLGYLALMVLALVNLVLWTGWRVWWVPEMSWDWCRWVLMGCYAQHWIHLAVDAASSGAKRLR